MAAYSHYTLCAGTARHPLTKWIPSAGAAAPAYFVAHDPCLKLGDAPKGWAMVMEKKYLIDLMLLNDGMYRAVLLPAPALIPGGIGGGACPQIPTIQPEVFMERLERVLGFTRKELDKIKERIKADPELETEIPVSVTLEQLRQLGFIGIEQAVA